MRFALGISKRKRFAAERSEGVVEGFDGYNSTHSSALGAGKFLIGGDLPVTRLGYGPCESQGRDLG